MLVFTIKNTESFTDKNLIMQKLYGILWLLLCSTSTLHAQKEVKNEHINTKKEPVLLENLNVTKGSLKEIKNIPYTDFHNQVTPVDNLPIYERTIDGIRKSPSLHYMTDVDKADTLHFLKNGYFYGTSSVADYPGMMNVRSTSGVLQYNVRKVSFSLQMMANRYSFFRSVKSQYGVAANFTYAFSPNVSMTVFGQYFNVNPYFSMGTFPYIPTSRYGGYVTLWNNRWGIDLGAERRYDSFRRTWNFVPIITPKYKISKRITLELPVGDLSKYMIERLVKGGRRQGPMILPDNF